MVKKSRKYLENIFLSVTYDNYVSVLGDMSLFWLRISELGFVKFKKLPGPASWLKLLLHESSFWFVASLEYVKLSQQL